jgi:hypothetical protein
MWDSRSSHALLWEYKLVWPLWKKVLPKLKILSDHMIQQSCPHIHTETCARMFAATLLIIAKI